MGSRRAFVTAATSVTEGQPNFARWMAVSWAARAGTLYTFGVGDGLLPTDGILPGAKFTVLPGAKFALRPKSCVLLY